MMGGAVKYLAVSFLAVALAAMAFWEAGVAAEGRLPVFDTHVHYSQEAWQPFSPGAILDKLTAAGVARALVSSTPDDGTLKLYRADRERIVPILRPYRDRADMDRWFRDRGVIDYVAGRLGRGVYRGIGEFHLLYESEARTPEIRRLAKMAVARDIVLHVHSGDRPVRALFAVEPRLKVLWAHAGMAAPPGMIRRLLESYPLLWTEVSFRADDIAPDGRLDPAWRKLFLDHPDRFMVGTDTYVNARWEIYSGLVEEHRRWLAQLPRKVAKAIAHGNAVKLFGAGRGTGLGD